MPLRQGAVMAFDIIIYKYLLYKQSVAVIDELQLPAALLLTTITFRTRERGRPFVTGSKGKIYYQESNQRFSCPLPVHLLSYCDCIRKY